MSCIVKSFSKKVQEKHNLSPYFAEFFFQLYNIKYGENSEFDESKFDDLINSYKQRENFTVDNEKLLNELNKFIEEKTDNGFIYFNNVTQDVKSYIKKIENSFGKEGMFAWVDKNGKVYIKLNQPSLNKEVYHEHETTNRNFLIDKRLSKLRDEQIKTEKKEGKEKANTDVLKTIVSYLEENPNYKGIIQMLKEKSIGKEKLLTNVKIKIDEFTGNYYDGNNRRRRAYYETKSKTIHIDELADFNEGKSDSVIMHEIMHAITVNKILDNQKYKDEIQGYINEFVKYNPEYYYSYNNEHGIEEFVADVWSNQDIINKLKQIKSTKKQTLWDKIKKFFVGLFEDAEGTLLADVSEAIYNLLDKQNSNIYNGYSLYEQEERPSFTKSDVEDTSKKDATETKAESAVNLINDTNVYVNENSIFAKIHKWKQVETLTAKEKQEMSDSIMKNFSYFINKFFDKPDSIKNLKLPYKEDYIDDIINEIKAGKLSRKGFIKKVTYANLLKKYKFYILKYAQFNKEEIKDNWDAIMFNGRNILAETEGMTMKPNSDFSDLNDNIYDLFEEATSDQFEGKEEEEIEAYQIENDRRSVSDSLSQEIKNVINILPIKDSFTKWCGLRFEDGNAICKKILEICSSAESYNDMINRLESKAEIYDWINPLLDKLKYSRNLRQLFYKNFKKNFIKRAIIRNREGQFVPFIINYDEEITSIRKENIRQYWWSGFNSMFFTFSGRTKSGKAFGYVDEKNLKNINEVLDNLENKKAESFDVILKNLGFDINVDILKKILNTKKESENLIKNISDILNILKESNEELIQYSRGTFGSKISNRAGNILSLISVYDPIYVESSTIQNGKNYYGYVYPSFLNDLFDKLKNVESLDDADYIKSIKDLYADDYLFDKNGNSRNDFLLNLINDKSFRKKIDKVSLLNFVGKGIEDMTARDLLHTQLAMFALGQDSGLGMYSCGVFSNKKQIQFISNKRYNSLDEAKDTFFNICMQELDRIRDVILRSEDKNLTRIEFYDIDKKTLSNIKEIKFSANYFKELSKSPNGASFKHLSFLNNILFNENHKIGNAFREYIETGNINLLRENFDNLFLPNGEFKKYFESEYKWIEESNIMPKSEDGKFFFSEDEIKSFILSNFIAQIQFSQLFQIDLAYNKNAEDTQKRAAALIAPGLKLDVEAQYTDQTGKHNFSDGIMRTVIIQKQKIISDVINVLNNIFENKAKEFFPDENTKKVSALANILITRLKKTYEEVDSSDGQSWMSPTGYWKKLGMEGENTDEIQKMIGRISNGNLNLNDIATVLGQPQKPVVYGFNKMDYSDKDYEFKRKQIPTYIKDSEVTLLLADAIIRGAKEDSILTGLFELMEESHYNNTTWNNGTLKGKRGSFKTNGIDNITMSSAVKTGLKGAIDLSYDTIDNYIKNSKKKISKSQAVKEIIKSYIYNADGSYNQEYLTQISFENYRIQQEVPPHLRNHKQQLGSQPRVLMPIDINPDDNFELDGNNIKGKDLQEQYFNYLEQYYKIAKKDIEKIFGLSNDNKKNLINKIIENTNKIEDNNKRFLEIYRSLLNAVKRGKISYLSAFGFKTEKDLIDGLANKKKIKGLLTKIYNKNKLEDTDYMYSDAEKNLILSNILVDQINSDSRYDVELINAVSINPLTGKFNTPLNDPVNHDRFEQLICSIIKKSFVKQSIDGGPVVQASSYGLNKKLNIRYYKPNSKELIMTKSEFEKKKSKSGFNSYEEYIDYIYTDKNGNKITPIIAYHEIAITIPWNNTIANKLIIKEGPKKGQLMTPQEAVEKGIINEKMLYAIGYRIPTENKSSIYPMKVVEFVPEGIGTCILLPEEITAVTGSDFDIDKTFVMFKSFSSDENGIMTENKDLSTKSGINNKLFDIYMSIFHNQNIQYLAHNPQGFEDIRNAQLRKKIKNETNDYKYVDLKNKSSKELERILEELNPLYGQNIHSLRTQLNFFEKNMEGRHVLGMFASSNTAHAFCQIHNQFLENDGKEKMWINVNDLKLNGEIFNNQNKLYIDGIYNRDKTMYISTAMGEFVGASADIVKDDVLTDFNANPKTVNILTMLIRCGFSHDFVCMFLNQPVVKKVLSDVSPILKLNYWIKDFKSKNRELFNIDSDTGYIIIPDDIKFTTEELFEHLNDNDSKDVYQLYVAVQLRKLLDVAGDFLTLSLETKYNSIKNSVGPSIINNIMAKERHEGFIKDDSFKIKNAQNIVKRNPLLNILYEEQFGDYSLLQRILGNNTVEYNKTFMTVFKKAKAYLNRNNFNDKDLPLINMLMNDFNYYRLTSENGFLNQSYEERKKLYNFTDEFKDFKAYCLSNGINNDFLNILYLDKYDNLCFNTKRMKAENINHIKFSIEELAKSKDEKIRSFIERCFLYFLQKQGFSFDPNGDIKIFPEYIKSNVKYGKYTFFDYVSKTSFGIPKNDEVFTDNFMIQFFRNHFEFAPKVKMHNVKDKWFAGYNEVSFDKDKLVVHKIKGGTFNSYERDFGNDRKDFLPIVRTNKDLYICDGLDSNGDLIYSRTYELGTHNQHNLKEYNANLNQENGKTMIGIANKLKESVQKNMINDDYDAPKNIPEGQEGIFKLILELYKENNASKLSMIYKVETGKKGFVTNGQIVTKEAKEEIKKMINIKSDKNEITNDNTENVDTKDNSGSIISEGEKINKRNSKIETYTDESRNNASNKFVVNAIKNLSSHENLKQFKELFDALYNEDKEKVKTIYDTMIKQSKTVLFAIKRKSIEDAGISSNRFFKFVEDYLNGNIQEKIKDLC